MAEIVHLEFYPRNRKQPGVPSSSLAFHAGLGIEGDHHAKKGSSRQVLLMSEKNGEAFGLSHGQARENIVTRGLDVQNLPAGTRLRAGGVVLEITKDCAPCGFMDSIRPGLQMEIRGKRGMLAKVIESGEMRVGDEISAI